MPRIGSPRPTRLGCTYVEGDGPHAGSAEDASGGVRGLGVFRGWPPESPQLASALIVAVASTLGTGILALPMRLARSGFQPFFACLVVVLFMQLAIVCLMVELLQRTHVELVYNAGARDAKVPVSSAQDLPDLHRMGRLFLSASAASVFDVAVLLHFGSVLISYNLAGSEAYAGLLGMNYRALIIPFWGVNAFVVLFGSRRTQPVISVLTTLKCAIFFVVMLAVAVVGSKIGVRPSADWSHGAEPFLVSTFALGGAANTMPVTYANLPFRTPMGTGAAARRVALRANAVLLRRYRAAVAGGVGLCFVTNALWCACVLHVVPQRASQGVSLEDAARHGQVSTVAVASVIEADPRAGHFRWVSAFLDTFVIISVSASFITVGVGLKHVLDGLAISRSADNGELLVDESADERSLTMRGGGHQLPPGEQTTPQNPGDLRAALPFAGTGEQELDPPLPCGLARTVRQYRLFLYSTAFGLVLLISLANPEGFLIVIEVFGSFALNLECGVFVSLMAWAARCGGDDNGEGIPLALGRWVQLVLIGFTGLLFSATCTYDFVTAGVAAVSWRPRLVLVTAGCSGALLAVLGLRWRGQSGGGEPPDGM